MITCLLPRQVGESPSGRLPLVATSRGAPAVALLARNADEYIHRCCSAPVALSRARSFNSHPPLYVFVFRLLHVPGLALQDRVAHKTACAVESEC